jgi:hypothetical protein
MNILKYSLLFGIVLCCSGAGYRHQYNTYNTYNNVPAAYSYANQMFTPVVVQTTRVSVDVVASQPVVPAYTPVYYPYEYYSISNRPYYWVYVHNYGWICRFY